MACDKNVGTLLVNNNNNNNNNHHNDNNNNNNNDSSNKKHKETNECTNSETNIKHGFARARENQAATSRVDAARARTSLAHIPPAHLPASQTGRTPSTASRTKKQQKQTLPTIQTRAGTSHSKGTSQPPAPPVSTHAKQQNPSRIQAQRVATWSAEPVPFSTFEPAKSKGGWVGLEALAGIGWVDVPARNGDVVRSFTHACPSCGTMVQSAKASGRLQIKHQKPNGKACPTTVWVGK